jgi:cystathionine beta-lyase family protein involved in aluminum resistance
MGGTVIPLAADGTIKNPYIYYCGYANGQIDWSQWM